MNLGLVGRLDERKVQQKVGAEQRRGGRTQAGQGLLVVRVYAIMTHSPFPQRGEG